MKSDGLAMSSRNTYLSSEERKQALVLSKSLKKAEEAINNGEKDLKTIKDGIRKIISEAPLADIEYIEAYTFPGLSECGSIISEKDINRTGSQIRQHKTD